MWEKVISDKNIEEAIRKATKGKRDRPEVAYIFEHIDKQIPLIRKYAQNYMARQKKPRIVKEGAKERVIVVPSIREQILHHMIVGVLQPIIMKGMYEHSHGSIPGRGPAGAKKQIKRWIKDTKNVKYFLKMDIHHFFASIPHDMLKEFIAKYIHDERFLHLIFEVIDCTETGLPLGFHTSHWFANWYLQGLDRYIKQQLGAVYYVRYMDDMVIFGSNKRELHRMRQAIGNYLNGIGLELKRNWQVCRFHTVRNGEDRYRFLDFMGFRFYRNRITLRKGIMLRMTRRAKRYNKHKSIYAARQMLSALGWIKQTDVYDMYLAWIKPYVNFQTIKRKISRYDRRIRRERLNVA